MTNRKGIWAFVTAVLALGVFAATGGYARAERSLILTLTLEIR